MDDEGDENVQKIKCLDFYEAVVPLEIRIQNEFDFIHKAGDRRMLFMPHSPGIYVALVLKDVAAIDEELENEHETTTSNISALMLNK